MQSLTENPELDSDRAQLLQTFQSSVDSYIQSRRASTRAPQTTNQREDEIRTQVSWVEQSECTSFWHQKHNILQATMFRILVWSFVASLQICLRLSVGMARDDQPGEWAAGLILYYWTVWSVFQSKPWDKPQDLESTFYFIYWNHLYAGR